MTKRLLAAALLLTALAPMARAACTDQAMEAKTIELTNLLMPLMQRNPAEAHKISEAMTAAMGQPASDQTCALYDSLIARAKR
ncbi:hypothetical protein JMJ55_00615 [Belnapia sp. T6]|uniref:Uncharacterized protein n=1 Tax=Belnapia mucosa TaxID=2804532 RepID=A0ABS1UYC4_9PROT|nr:hypothetical protein [Belnapia mucosa]MBL6453801.1 hypothetical protein [Belnapia mucosa]